MENLVRRESLYNPVKKNCSHLKKLISSKKNWNRHLLESIECAASVSVGIKIGITVSST